MINRTVTKCIKKIIFCTRLDLRADTPCIYIECGISVAICDSGGQVVERTLCFFVGEFGGNLNLTFIGEVFL